MKAGVKILLAIGLAGIGGLLLFQIIGSTIDEDGILHEPFFLIPVSYLLMVLGFGGAALLGLRHVLRRGE